MHYQGTMIIAQCRMARAALRWSLDDLATESGVGRRTIAKFEAGGSVVPETLDRLAAAFIGAGVAFIDEGGRVGVSVRRVDA